MHIQNVPQILEDMQRSKGSDISYSTVDEAVDTDDITHEDLGDLRGHSMACQATVETASVHTQVEQRTSNRGMCI